MKKTLLVCLLTLTLLASACTPAEPGTLIVMTHSSFDVSEEVVAAFESQYNAKVQFIASGDTGSALNKAILSADNPVADVFYGVDNTFLSRALAENIFEAYHSPLLEGIPDEFRLDPEDRALPVDYGDVCLNYDIAYFADRGLQPPQNLEDLLLPEYRGMLVVQDPASSSPGLAFLLATIARFGTDGYLPYWQGLVENDVKVVSDWTNAYYAEFTRWGGAYPVVVSYSSSPAFELIEAEEPMATPPTAAITADGACFRQVEFVGILRGTPNRRLAEQWVDFMLSTTFQEDMPFQMYVFPVNPEAALDQAFVDFLTNPLAPGFLPPADIAANRETWINAWREAVLK